MLKVSPHLHISHTPTAQGSTKAGTQTPSQTIPQGLAAKTDRTTDHAQTQALAEVASLQTEPHAVTLNSGAVGGSHSGGATVKVTWIQTRAGHGVVEKVGRLVDP